jgi:hypothetical protein
MTIADISLPIALYTKYSKITIEQKTMHQKQDQCKQSNTPKVYSGAFSENYIILGWCEIALVRCHESCAGENVGEQAKYSKCGQLPNEQTTIRMFITLNPLEVPQ